MWGVKMEALGVMMALLTSFGKICAPHMGPAMSACWQLYGTSLPAYEALVVTGEEAEEGAADSGAQRGGRGGSNWGAGLQVTELCAPLTPPHPTPRCPPPFHTDGGTVDFEALVSQLMEFVLAVAGSARYEGAVRAGMTDLLHLALGYAQMTAGQVGGGVGGGEGGRA